MDSQLDFDVLTLSRKHWKNHFMVYRLVNTSWLSCSNKTSALWVNVYRLSDQVERGSLVAVCWNRKASHQMLFQFGHHLLQDSVVVLLETHQFWKTRNKKPWDKIIISIKMFFHQLSWNQALNLCSDMNLAAVTFTTSGHFSSHSGSFCIFTFWVLLVSVC